jgi:glycosyltransferase involved in cell wall biosynthesis
MCVYNTLPYIKAATDSILNQTYENWELIIAEDAATDGTREWLKENLSSAA